MPFHGPVDAIERVLRKLGLDPGERITESCQDPEYTACRADELSAYFELYSSSGLDPWERAVLCCFLLEALNDFCANGTPHDLQSRILQALFAAGEDHGHELAYWMDTSDPDPENWWPITPYLLEHLGRPSTTGGTT